MGRVLGALIGRGADVLGGFELDQLLERDAHGLRITSTPSPARVEEFGQDNLGQGHWWTSFLDECLAVHTEDPALGSL